MTIPTTTTPTLPSTVTHALDALDAAGRAYRAATGDDPDAYDQDAGDAEIEAVNAALDAVAKVLIAAKCRAEHVHAAGEHLVEVCYQTGAGRMPEVTAAARLALARLLAPYAPAQG